MNKKADFGDVLIDNLIYLILLVIFIAGVIAFIYSNMNGANVWGDYYVKQVVGIVDLAKPGDVIIIDVQKATEIAKKNKVFDFEEIFRFDNMKSEVCVKLSQGRINCFNFFNNVNVAPDSSQKWVHLAEPVNRLHLQIIAKEAS